MTQFAGMRPAPAAPNVADLFTPKLVTALSEGYSLDKLRCDAIAGLTVAIVALPLSMAIAIASGTTPDRGLYTAIVGGFLVSALGGSRFQIGGPAGAFIVLVLACVTKNGIEGLILATMMSGLFMLVLGYARLGSFIKLVPYPVTVGFTAGIAVIIFASQIRELLGLTLTGPEPGPLIAKVGMLAQNLGTVDPAAVFIAGLAIAIIVVTRTLRPGWPGMLIAVAACSIVALVLGLDVATIGTKFGGIPRTLPAPELPEITFAKIQAVLPDAIAFTLLGAIESLLSAVVADGMSGRRHRSNCELVAQGYANIGSALFGGICVTGTIARTATNVRAGASSPVSGMLHSLFLLTFMLVAAPLASYIPLAALAGVLAHVAWNMIERPAIRALARSSSGDFLVLAATFLLTIFRDLTEGIVVGFSLGAVLFIHRMSKTIEVTGLPALVQEDRSDSDRAGERPPAALSDDVVVYRISGAFFFGAAAAVDSVLDRIGDRHRVLVLDLSDVPFLDSTAANLLEGVARKAKRSGRGLIIAGAARPVRRMLLAHGMRENRARFAPDLDAAAAMAAESQAQAQAQG